MAFVAFEVSDQDVADVLKTMGHPLDVDSPQVQGAFAQLDLRAVSRAASSDHVQELDDQAVAAHAEIRSQLIGLGVEPMPIVAVEAPSGPGMR